MSLLVWAGLTNAACAGVDFLPAASKLPEKTTPSPAWQRQVGRAEGPPKEGPLADPGPQEAIVAVPAPMSPAPAESSPAGGIASLLGVIWLAGTAVWLAWAGVRVVRFGRLLRHARPAPEEVQGLARRLAARLGLARCPAVRLLAGPLPVLVWAVGRPVVYFPAGLLARLGEEERASLLIHELAHIRRRDHWVRWLEVLVLSLYWWYPLAWWARKQMQEREEECCDAWVVGESSPRVYALAILATVAYLAEMSLPLPAVASGLGGKEILKRRLTLIMAGKTPGRLSRAGLAALLAVCAALPLAPAPGAPEEKPAEPAKEARQPGADNPDREPIQFDPDPTVFQPLDGRLWSLAFAPAGKTVASAGGEWDKPGELVLWDAASGKPRVRVREDKGLRWIAYSPDGKLLATATASSRDHTARIRDAATGKVLRVLQHPEAINSVAFSPDSKLLVTAGLDRNAFLWDLETGKEKAVLSGHGGGVYTVAFAPDGRSVASCGFDKTARVWDVATGRTKLVLQGHEKPVESVAFSPDGRRIATASWDHTVKLWEAKTGMELATLQGHTRSVLCLAFSPDSKVLASGSGKWGEEELPDEPGEIKLWDVAGRKELASLRGHEDRVWSLSFSADGKTLVSCGFDKTVRLWDVAGRKEKAKLVSPEDPAVAFQPILAGAHAPESNLLALATEANTIHLLDPAAWKVRHVLTAGGGGNSGMVAFEAGEDNPIPPAGDDFAIRLWDPTSIPARD
jgi:WD40 repeat protein/beta-lactamase regulating signal transducer with metallopeptidase domain